jgi:hypothetical protein
VRETREEGAREEEEEDARDTLSVSPLRTVSSGNGARRNTSDAAYFLVYVTETNRSS